MTKQILSNSLIALALMFVASSATHSFAQKTTAVTSAHVLSAGDPGGGEPDPTGGPGGNGLALHLR